MEVSEPLLCWVTPMAQRMQTPLASAIMCATFFSVSTGRPQVCEANSRVNGSRASAILLQSVDPLAQEFGMGEALVENVTRDRRRATRYRCRAWGAGRGRRGAPFRSRAGRTTMSFWP